MTEPAANIEIPHGAGGLNGQPAAFESMFQHFHPRLVRFLSKRLEGSMVDPEDVAQETMVKAWQKRDKFDPRYQFSTWVYTIAQRTATDHLRKRTRYECSERLDSLVQPDRSPDQSILAEEAVESLWTKAAEILSQRQYSVLWLRYGEEMSIKEVSKALSITSVSVRVLLYRARVSLQPYFELEQRVSGSQGDSKS